MHWALWWIKARDCAPFFVLVGNLVGIWLIWKTAISGVQVAISGVQTIMTILGAINPFTGYVIAIMAIVGGVVVALAYLHELQNTFEEMMDFVGFRHLMRASGIIPASATDADIDEAISGSLRRERGGKSVFGQFDDPRAHLKNLFSDQGMLGSVGAMAGTFFGKLNFANGALGPSADLQALNTPGIVKNGHTNVNVRIEQTVKTDEDPERIRILTRQGLAEALDQALHHPQETPGSHFSVLRY